jgi:hypothetical protein
MRALYKYIFLLGLISLCNQVDAAHIKVDGLVRELHNEKPMKGVLVRLYKNGMKIHAEPTAGNGKFQFRLQNNARYIIRVSAPGHITKCFQIDTHGASWMGDGAVNELKVEMTMMEKIDGFDHSYFDMPLGLAKFNPTTGFLSWSKKYEQQINPEVIELMAEYNDKLILLASLEEE